MLTFNMMNKFASNDSGATAIEYGLIAALVSIVLVTVLTKLGTTLDVGFNKVVVGLKTHD